MTDTAPLTLNQKIRLFLAAHAGMNITGYEVAAEGRAWKDDHGKACFKSRLVYTKEADGLVYFRNFRRNAEGNIVDEDAAYRSALYTHLAHTGLFACHRCGGAGGFRHWPGFFCFECNGDKVDRSIDINKELDKAIAGQDFGGDYLAKVKADKEAKQSEFARQQAENAIRQATIVREWKEANTGLLERARAALAFLGVGGKGEWANRLETFISAAEFATSCDSLPSGYLNTEIEGICDKVEARQIEAHRQAQISKHVGQIGERIEITARVTFVKEVENEFGVSHLTVLATDDGSVLKYWNEIRLPDPQDYDPKAKRPAAKDERVTFSAKVVAHDFYQGVPQTQIQRVTKARLAE